MWDGMYYKSAYMKCMYGALVHDSYEFQFHAYGYGFENKYLRKLNDYLWFLQKIDFSIFSSTHAKFRNRFWDFYQKKCLIFYFCEKWQITVIFLWNTLKKDSHIRKLVVYKISRRPTWKSLFEVYHRKW